MKKYYDYCLGYFDNVEYIDSCNENSDIRILLNRLLSKNIKKINYIDPCDNWLNKRIKESGKSIVINIIDSPQFINSNDENSTFFNPDKKKYFQTSFYKLQRKKMGILMVGDNPEGGKWTYDDENRKKIPLTQTIPNMPPFKRTKYHELILSLVHQNFSDHPGETQNCWIPTTRLDAKEFFCEFLNVRFEKFGDYEDAIDTRGHFLFHSGISALLNIGLLLPKEVISETIKFSENRNIEMNNLEGFVRQIIGWREFIKGTYELHSERQECSNFFKHNKRLSDHWYSASTGLGPLDDAIFGAIEYGYTHHINRLMVISNIMNLCEVDPKEIYKWFMEMFIDSSEWVMVPNVYGMSTFADGGIFASKPYICGSNYILKMGNSKKGDWCEIVDGLYWRFIQKNISFFEKNHRLSFMTKALNKIDAGRRDRIFAKAENFINEYTIS